jgi:hypothetical protein
MARRKPYRPPTSITLAGIPVRRELVEWLAGQLPDDPAGDRLRRALDNDTRILGLEIEERETILTGWTTRPPGSRSSEPCFSPSMSGGNATASSGALVRSALAREETIVP